MMLCGVFAALSLRDRARHHLSNFTRVSAKFVPTALCARPRWPPPSTCLPRDLDVRGPAPLGCAEPPFLPTSSS
eukprot:6212543-Pyramimonas_sp.AAC.1